MKVTRKLPEPIKLFAISPAVMNRSYNFENKSHLATKIVVTLFQALFPKRIEAEIIALSLCTERGKGREVVPFPAPRHKFPIQRQNRYNTPIT
jgi:hypothetical protein